MPELAGKLVGPIGYGLMGLATSVPPIADEQGLQAMRAALESGCNFWNAGEHYGSSDRNSQTFIAAYLKRYPEDAEKIVLSVKGAFDFATMKPDGSPEGIKRSLDKILGDLNGTKKVDIFECARVDPDTPLEVTFKYLEEEYIKKGVVGGISLSEVSAATIRRAASITKIVAVEVELSLWSTHVLENGVATACAELKIPLIAYSPIGKGMLSGKLKSLNDLPEGDSRRMYPRFAPENFPLNLQLVGEIQELAKQRGCTAAQLAVNWTRSLSRQPNMPQIIPLPGATLDSRVRENSKAFELTEAEMSAIDKILAKFPTAGSRYPDFVPVDG